MELSRYLRAKKEGRTTAPYIPQATLMPVHKLCQLALSWREAGFEKEAGELAYWLAPLEPFPTLWCPEKEFNEKEAARLFSLLSTIQPIPSVSPLEFTRLEQAVFTLSGHGTSLGMIPIGQGAIRAFGPQSPSLQFGIEGEGIDGWTRSKAFPEVWLEMKSAHVEGKYQLDLRFVGLMPATPLSFAFYVKAGSCQIGPDLLKPKSLRRFNGEGRGVQLDNWVIESAFTHKMEVIPLAGEGCFWDSEFLVSFEIHPISPQISFSIYITK